MPEWTPTDSINNWSDELTNIDLAPARVTHLDVFVLLTDQDARITHLDAFVLVSEQDARTTHTAVFVLTTGEQVLSYSEDLDNWADAVNTSLDSAAVALEPSIDPEDLDNWNDSSVVNLTTAADSLDNWDDDVTTSLVVVGLAVSDDIDNWDDGTSTDPIVTGLDLSEDLNNWADNFSVYKYPLDNVYEDDLNNWADSVSAARSATDVSASDDMYFMVEGRWVGEDLDPSSEVALYGVTGQSASENTLNNWADAAPQLTLYGALSPAETTEDDLDNWNDAATVVRYDHLTVSKDDDLDNWNDAVSTTLSFRFSTTGYTVLMELQFSSGTQYLSNETIRHPTRIYREDVISFGVLDRSIPAPAGLPRISDITIKLKDRERTYRKLFTSSAVIEVPVVLKMGPRGSSESNFLNIYRGKVTSVTFPPGSCEITVTDSLFEILADQVPTLIDSTNFTLPSEVSEAFAPIIYGDLDTTWTTVQGAVQCIPLSTTRYILARHQVKEVLEVFISEPDSVEFDITSATTSSFSDLATSTRQVYEVYSGSWSLTEEIKTINGTDYTFTYLDFSNALTEGTQVRVDVQGIADHTDTVLENPVDILKHYLEVWVGIPVNSNNYNLARFEEVRSLCESLDYTGAYAYVDSMTHSEAISRLLQSFNLDLFCDVGGRISVALTVNDPSNVPNFEDIEHILRDSVIEQLPSSTYNKFNYRYGFTPCSKEWYYEEVYNNELDQEVLGEVLEEDIDLHFVRDDLIVEQIVADIAGYLDLSSTRITLKLSGPRVVEKFDLADFISIGHYEGLEENTGIYTDQKFKVVGARFNLDTFEYEIDGVIRANLPVRGGGPLTNVAVEHNLYPGPFQYGRASNFFGVFLQTDGTVSVSPGTYLWGRNYIKVAYTRNWGRTWNYVYPDTRYDWQIGSLNAYQDGQYLHIVIQCNGDGIVDYYRFNCSTLEFDIEADSVMAADTTTISSTFRSGYGYGGFGMGNPTRPFADVIVRSNGEVLAFYKSGSLETDPGNLKYSLGADDFWFAKIYCKVRNPSTGSWSSAFRAGSGNSNSAETGVASDSDLRLAPVLGRDGLTVYLHSFTFDVGLLGNIWPDHMPCLLGISSSNLVILATKYQNLNILTAGVGLGGPPARVDSETDNSFKIYAHRPKFSPNVSGTLTLGSDGQPINVSEIWHIGSFSDYTTQNHGVPTYAPYTEGNQAHWPGFRRSPCEVHYANENIYYTNVLVEGGFTSSDPNSITMTSEGAITSKKPSNGVKDGSTYLFVRGGRLYNASFVMGHWNDIWFEVWSENDWGDNMVTYAEFIADYTGE